MDELSKRVIIIPEVKKVNTKEVDNTLEGQVFKHGVPKNLSSVRD